MSYTHPMGHNVILVPSTVTYATNVAHTTTVDTTWDTGGIFILEAKQGAGTYGNETLDVDIVVYEEVTDDWYTIASFTQVTDATTAVQELIKIPYGLGRKISCEWTIANAVVGEAYTITVSGVLK